MRTQEKRNAIWSLVNTKWFIIEELFPLEDLLLNTLVSSAVSIKLYGKHNIKCRLLNRIVTQTTEL